MPFTLGDLMIIELALLNQMKSLDLSLQIGQQYLDVVSKCEAGIRELSASSSNPGPAPLPSVGAPSSD